MFKSGASKARRNAAKQSAAQYWDTITNIRNTAPPQRLDTLDVDGVNRPPEEYNKAVDAYTARFAELNKQLAGGSISRFKVSDNSSGPGGLGSSLPAAPQSSMFNTREEALAAAGTIASAKKAATRVGNEYVNLRNIPQRGNSILGQATKDPFAAESYVETVNYGKIDGGYRSLGAMKQATEELSTLAGKVNAMRKASNIDSSLGVDNSRENAMRRNAQKQGKASTILAGQPTATTAQRTVLGA